MTSGFRVREHTPKGPSPQSPSTTPPRGLVPVFVFVPVCHAAVSASLGSLSVCLCFCLSLHLWICHCVPCRPWRKKHSCLCGFRGSFSKDPLHRGSKGSLGQTQALFWNQTTSELGKALEMPCLGHLLLETGKIGCILWEGREAVGMEKEHPQ